MRNVTARDVRTLLTAALFVGAATSGALAQSLPAPWNAIDIGSPAVAGSAASASGTFTVDAAGTDIAGTADQFHYVYRPVTGRLIGSGGTITGSIMLPLNREPTG